MGREIEMDVFNFSKKHEIQRRGRKILSESGT